MKRIALCACVLALAGCAMFHKDSDLVPACPDAGLVKGASFFPMTVGDAPHQAAGDLAAAASLKTFSRSCEYRKNGEVDVKLTLNFTGQRGARGEKLETQSFPYFIAVLSPSDQILQRQVFSTSVDFDNTTGAGASSEDHTIRIPLKDVKQGPNYKIAMGFTLTPKQAQYNKENNAN